MITGANGELYKLNNSSLPTLFEAQFPRTFVGSNVWLFDARRYYADYRTTQPTDGTVCGIFGPHPIDVTGVSTFGYLGSASSPPNAIFRRSINGAPALEFEDSTYKVFLSTSTLNTTNSATGLTALYRFRLDAVNTTYNYAPLFYVGNGTSNANRFSINFDNQYGAGNGIITATVNNVDSATSFTVVLGISLSSIIGKFVNLVVDMNYSTKLFRAWVNGRLINSQTITAMTAGAIPNTNMGYVSVINDSAYPWFGYCTYARMLKNTSLTNEDVVKLSNQMEIVKYNN